MAYYGIAKVLYDALETLEKHKFGSKTALTQKRAKENAERFQGLLKQLPQDLANAMKNLWLIEYTINNTPKGQEQAKALRKKSKEIKEYIKEEINSIVWP